MWPLARSLVGRVFPSFAGATKRSLATCEVLLSSENCSFFKNRQVAAQSAPLVNAVNRRHKWMDMNGHPRSILPFIRSGEAVTHMTMWEEACTVDTMKAHLTTLSAASRLPCTTAVSPEPPRDSLDGQLSTHDGCPEAVEQDDGPTHRQETAEPVPVQVINEKPKITIKEQQEAVVKVLETVIAHSFYGEGTPWSREEENKLLLTHLADLTASERELREKTHAIFKTRNQLLVERMMRANTVVRKLRRVRKSKRIIFSHLRSMDSWERRGACEYEREKRLMYVTLRLEHEADVMEEKKKQRLKNFRGFLRSLGEMLSVWYWGG